MNSTLWTLVLCIALSGGLDRPAFGAQAAEPPQSEPRALVVGVGRYANPAIWPLEGAENDAVLVRSLLVDHLGFAPERVKVLSTALGAEDQPTRARILAELDALADARPERAVVYFSGHGSFVPDQKTEEDGKDEVDGTDEVFLPTDAGSWDERRGVAENVLLDDEIGAALTRLEEVGSFVWFWTDSCSSGTQDRGADDEVREVSPAALGVPAEALARVGPASPLDEVEELSPDRAGRRVVFTACRSRQKSKSEDALHPLDSSAGVVKLGVFTRLVAQEIVRSEGTATYQQIIDRVALAAPAAQRPTASGALHRVLLDGDQKIYRVGPARAAWRFALDAGAAQGVEPGARVRVEIYAGDWVDATLLDVREETSWIDLDPDWGIPVGEFEDARVARWGERELEARLVRDESRWAVDAGELAGVEQGDTFRAEWGDGEVARLQVVELQPGRSLVVPIGDAQVPDDGVGAKLELRPRERLVAVASRSVNEELAGNAAAGVERARLRLASREDADWVLELGPERHVLSLGSDPEAASYWVGTDAEDVLSALARVYRAESLRSMGADSRLQAPPGLVAELCTRAPNELDPGQWTPIGRAPISPGSYAGLRVKNETDVSYTAWMFMLDRNHSIGLINPDDEDRRVVRAGTIGHRYRTSGLDFSDDPQGPEHVLVLFVEDDSTSSLAWLAQSGLDPVDGVPEGVLGEAVAFSGAPRMRGGDQLGALLGTFAEPTRGGVARPGRMFAQLLSYEVRWDIPVLARPAGLALDGAGENSVRRLFAGLPVAIVPWSDASDLEVLWIEGQEGTCAWASDGTARAIALDVDGDPEGEWTPELVLVERGATRTIVELDAGGSPLRARVDDDGDGVCERRIRRSASGWVEMPSARVPLLVLADLELGEAEWSSLQRVRDVFATFRSTAPVSSAAPSGTQDASSSFAPGTGAGEAPTPKAEALVTESDVRSIVDELAGALEEELDVPLLVELVDEPQVNARAWRQKDAGRIVVFQGLIDAFGGDVDLLRAVLAHELVHVTEFHSRQRTGAMDLDLHLMRAQETQADLEGAALLEAAGYPRRDLTRALLELDDYTKSRQVLWHQIVSGDHPSFYARIAELEPQSKAAEALAAFERGLAFLECRRPDAARIAFEEALSLAPQLDEARFNLVRAAMQSYYDELPESLRAAWLEPEFGPVLTEVSTVEVRGAADMERYLELVRLANELPEGVRDPQRTFLRGTIFVLHPEDDRAAVEEGVRLLSELADTLESTSGDQGSAVVATGDPSDPTSSRLALMPLSTKELRLQAFTNVALGLHRLGRGDLAWGTLMGAIRPDPPFQPPTSLATNLARLHPPELDDGDRELLVAYLQLRYQTANPASVDHLRCETMLTDLAGEQSLAGLFEAGPRYAPPTAMHVLGGELELQQAFARDDARFGKPAQSGPLARQYPSLRHCRWENPDGEGDLVIFTENDRIVQVTSSIAGASLPMTPAEGRPGVDSAEVRVGMSAAELDALLGNTYRYHSLRNPYPSKGKISARRDERWRYYAHLNLGVLVLDDVAEAVTVTAALR